MMTDPFDAAPLLLAHLRSKLQEFVVNEAALESLAVDLGEIFYDCWKGMGLERQLLDAEDRKTFMRALVDLQILLEHLSGHVASAIAGLNSITRMD